MNRKLAMLAQRRQTLVKKAALQRVTLAQNIAQLRNPIATADLGFQVFHYFKQHPFLMLSATALINMISLNRLGRWLKSSISVLHFAHSVISLWIKK
ncbi:MAG: hypothetical protein FJY53_07340 [Betaproteobacteria bacterium]|nr:hypothetical protein [Betaproteobacteria bacterium]